LTVSSLLPDTSDVPSSEKVRDLTEPVCPERTATWLPVIPSVEHAYILYYYKLGYRIL